MLTDALRQWHTLGLPLWQARTLRDLAGALAVHDPATALAHWESAAGLFTANRAREAGELAGLTPRAWLDQVRAVR